MVYTFHNGFENSAYMELYQRLDKQRVLEVE